MADLDALVCYSSPLPATVVAKAVDCGDPASAPSPAYHAALCTSACYNQAGLQGTLACLLPVLLPGKEAHYGVVTTGWGGYTNTTCSVFFRFWIE